MEPKRLTDPDQLGEWHITGRLGEGGFGTVFLAEKGTQKAAIKVIRTELVEEFDARNRLVIESEILSRISNPYIGRILDSDLISETPWIATEFINGPTLDEKVKYEGPLDEIVWFNLAANLFHAIADFNKLGVIHKDIKPSNIILGETGNKLIDFGIAHITGKTQKKSYGDREGSIFFSSPEHSLPNANFKMDVFSLATTLAYAGKTEGTEKIWSGKDELQLMRCINEDSPNLEGLTENQRNYLLPLFEKNPSDRPSSSDAYEKALQFIEFLVGKSAKPNPLKGRSVYKRILFSRKTSAFGAAAIVALFGFLFGGNFFGNDSQSDRLVEACKNSLQAGNLNFALEACNKAVTEGNQQAVIYLARAHKAIGSDDQARDILEKCKDQDVNCLSDYAYFFENGEKRLINLKSAESRGDPEAAWRIGNILEKDSPIEAQSFFEKGSKNGSAVASLLLATYWSNDKRGDFTKAINYAKLALGGDLTANPGLLSIDYPVERLIDAYYRKANDIPGLFDFLTDCANKKIIFCVSNLASTYLEEENYADAKKWGLEGAELKDGRSMYILGQVAAQKNKLLPKGTSDPVIDAEIVGWYKKAAEVGDIQGTFSLAFFTSMALGGIERDFRESCNLYQKTMSLITEVKGTYKEEIDHQETYKNSAQLFQLQSCQKLLLDGAPPITFDPIKPSKSPTPKPLASSNSDLEESVPNAKNIITLQPFGRVFEGALDWMIPLTLNAKEPVPPITGVQFRLLGFPNKKWLSIAYKLKTETDGGVYGQVDKIFLSILAQKQVCPEFRFVQIENNEVVKQWLPGLPECSNDYIP